MCARRRGRNLLDMLKPYGSNPRLHVAVAGGGIAALEALVGLRSLAGDRVDLTLISPDTEFHFRAFALGKAFDGDDVSSYDIGQIAADVGADFVLDSVREVVSAEHRIVLRSGRSVQYDALILAVGAHSYPAYAHGMSLDFGASATVLDDVLDAVDSREAGSIALVVPEGVSWTLPAYELAVRLRIRARSRDIHPELHLITPEAMPAAAFGASVSQRVAAAMKNADVDVRLNSIAIVLSDVALMSGGEWMTVSRILSLPRLAGPRMPGLPSDRDGFVPVDADGRVSGVADVYAAGDGTTQPIKQGGLASQQADTIAAAIARRAGVELPAPDDHRVLRAILTTTEGPLYLVAEVAGAPAQTDAAASRTPLWWPPTRVATHWLGPYLETTDGLAHAV